MRGRQHHYSDSRLTRLDFMLFIDKSMIKAKINVLINYRLKCFGKMRSYGYRSKVTPELSPNLKIGVTEQILQTSGNEQSSRDRLNSQEKC